MTATGWKAKGIEGVVIDGAARDVAWLRALGFPTFARAVTPRNYHHPAGVEHGAVNVPVVCAGVLLEPGDIVIGDDDGVVVVPRRLAAEIVTAATAFLEGEKAFRDAQRAVRLVPGAGAARGARLQIQLTPRDRTVWARAPAHWCSRARASASAAAALALVTDEHRARGSGACFGRRGGVCT